MVMFFPSSSHLSALSDIHLVHHTVCTGGHQLFPPWANLVSNCLSRSRQLLNTGALGISDYRLTTWDVPRSNVSPYSCP